MHLKETVWKTTPGKFDQKDPAFKLLEIRGISDPAEFLRITKKKLHNPYLMKEMKPAVTRIIAAIKAGVKIGIFGDYDADGVSSTSLWVLLLRELGADVIYFVPDRFKDGYGLNTKALDRFKTLGVGLVITCDTGITAIEQVRHAILIGLDIIITDHHEPQEIRAYDKALHKWGQVVTSDAGDKYLIPNTIVVNPKRPDCKYPFKALAGVGVSFKILSAVCAKLHPAKKAGAYQFMDIVTVGTLADQMDLTDENRVIAKYGLKMMRETKNRGLYQLMRACDLRNKKITSKDIGWTIAPCINAAGRIVSAVEAVEMLISDNKLDAYRCAKKLVSINEERKELTKQYVGDIIKSIEAYQNKTHASIVVHYHPAVPEGIVGLIAARVSNHFYKPAIILTDAEEAGLIKGSGRSIKGFDLFTALMLQTPILQGFGGHEAACGLSLKESSFEELRDRLEFYADSTLTKEDLQKKIYIDSVITKSSILDIDFVNSLRRLEPFGNGNQRPIFMMENVRVLKAFAAGKNKDHMWCMLKHGGNVFYCIGFFLWEKYQHLENPLNIDIAFTPSLNEYPAGSGKVSVQLELEDLRKAVNKKNGRDQSA